MYNTVREENVDLKNELEKSKAGMISPSESGQEDRLQQQVVSLKRELSSIESERDETNSRIETLTRSNSRLKGLMESLKQKLVSSNEQHRVITKEVESLHTELEAERRSGASANKSTTAAAGILSNSDPAVLQSQRDRAMREVERVKEELTGVSAEIEELQEDLRYEKEESEKLRRKYESLKAEGQSAMRGGSNIGANSAELSVLERQLSTQRREKVNAETTIEELKEEVRKLQKRYSSTGINGKSGPEMNVDEEMEEVVGNLVSTKLKLAESEDEKLRLHLALKQLKRHERGIQEKLAEHASSLEVRLGEANAELEKYRGMEQRGELPNFDGEDDDLDSNDEYEAVK
eukprot:Plantae.Rhodophyta-Hildenbrandia_rubra.ctg16401.p1 GENE.Plantae.Rhodophyta-Hildenbrandia_rubra.ctg16401~~Plantae.Rhodophyta-Hildenbrandia_rubra.ctg16401.p1  ORF type:complete len:348 (+),score=85.89 Plantae.Rhodophyta-Hildenbrandia_rubra.ctg16401:170-1213(+)